MDAVVVVTIAPPWLPAPRRSLPLRLSLHCLTRRGTRVALCALTYGLIPGNQCCDDLS